MKVEELSVLKNIEDEILTYIKLVTNKMIEVSLDEVYGSLVKMQLQKELEMYIHEKLVQLSNIYAKGSDEALINELCRYIIHKSSYIPIEPQGIGNHKIR